MNLMQRRISKGLFFPKPCSSSNAFDPTHFNIISMLLSRKYLISVYEGQGEWVELIDPQKMIQYSTQ